MIERKVVLAAQGFLESSAHRGVTGGTTLFASFFECTDTLCGVRFLFDRGHRRS